MNATPIQEVFDHYVFGFIKADIEREIQLAKIAAAGHVVAGVNAGGGNVLAALGLLCYTEFLGSFVTGQKGRGWSAKNGVAFLKFMGRSYRRELLHNGRLWDTFRNGLAHEYVIKENCDVVMLKGQEGCGLGRRDGRYYFVVEHYYEDFMAAATALRGRLFAHPVIPR